MGVIGSVVMLAICAVMLDPSMVVTGFTGIAAIAMGAEIVLTAGVAMLVSLFTSVDSEKNPNSYLAIIVVNGVLLYVFNPVTKPVACVVAAVCLGLACFVASGVLAHRRYRNTISQTV